MTTVELPKNGIADLEERLRWQRNVNVALVTQKYAPLDALELQVVEQAYTDGLSADAFATLVIGVRTAPNSETN
jgi:hypothetical protein